MKTYVPLITLQATPWQLPALDAAVNGYLRLLEVTVEPSQERTEIMQQLRSFQGSYQGVLQWVQAGGEAALIPLRVTPSELIAFGSAVIGYIRLLRVTVPPCELRNEVINHLLAFQKRYLDTLPSSPSFHRSD